MKEQKSYAEASATTWMGEIQAEKIAKKKIPDMGMQGYYTGKVELVKRTRKGWYHHRFGAKVRIVKYVFRWESVIFITCLIAIPFIAKLVGLI
jgi:hypothetical protein